MSSGGTDVISAKTNWPLSSQSLVSPNSSHILQQHKQRSAQSSQMQTMPRHHTSGPSTEHVISAGACHFKVNNFVTQCLSMELASVTDCSFS